MSKVLVSIIIPACNSEKLIWQTLDSVLEQSYSEWECIIIDDGSTDNTSDIINKYMKEDNRFLYYHRPLNKIKGPSSCRNLGIEKARGEYIIFLDSDDLFTKNCLEKRVKFAQLNSKFDFWIFKTKVFEKNPIDGNVIFNTKLEEYSDQVYLKLFFEGFHPFCVLSPLWRIEKLKIIGGFDEKLAVAEDPDLHIRAFLQGFKSLTKTSIEYDSLYRINSIAKIEDKENKVLIEKCNNSLYIIFKKFLKNHKSSIQLYCLKYFEDELLFKGSSKDINRFYLLYIRYNLFNLKQFFLIPVLLGYKILRLESINGLGFYSLKKYLF